MLENVNKVLDRGQKLEVLDHSAQKLAVEVSMDTSMETGTETVMETGMGM